MDTIKVPWDDWVGNHGPETYMFLSNADGDFQVVLESDNPKDPEQPCIGSVPLSKLLRDYIKTYSKEDAEDLVQFLHKELKRLKKKKSKLA